MNHLETLPDRATDLSATSRIVGSSPSHFSSSDEVASKCNNDESIVMQTANINGAKQSGEHLHTYQGLREWLRKRRVKICVCTLLLFGVFTITRCSSRVDPATQSVVFDTSVQALDETVRSIKSIRRLINTIERRIDKVPDADSDDFGE
jgi:hypothetical protein